MVFKAKPPPKQYLQEPKGHHLVPLGWIDIVQSSEVELLREGIYR